MLMSVQLDVVFVCVFYVNKVSYKECFRILSSINRSTNDVCSVGV